MSFYFFLEECLLGFVSANSIWKSANKSKGICEVAVAEAIVKGSLMRYNKKESSEFARVETWRREGFLLNLLHNLLQWRVAAIVRGILNVTSVISYDCTKFKNLIFMRSKLVIMVRVNLEFHRKCFVMRILRREGLNWLNWKSKDLIGRL